MTAYMTDRDMIEWLRDAAAKLRKGPLEPTFERFIPSDVGVIPQMVVRMLSGAVACTTAPTRSAFGDYLHHVRPTREAVAQKMDIAARHLGFRPKTVVEMARVWIDTNPDLYRDRMASCIDFAATAGQLVRVIDTTTTRYVVCWHPPRVTGGVEL